MAETIGFALQFFAASAASSAYAVGSWLVANAALVNFAGALVIGQSQKKRQQKKARSAAFASLKDGEVTLSGAVVPRRKIYGTDKVGVQLVYGCESGANGEYLHLVLKAADHQCEAIDGIYFGDVELPAPDGSGDITSGEYAKTATHFAVEAWSGTSKVLAHTPAGAITVTRDAGEGGADVLTLTTDYTVSGTTVTIPGGGSGYINYQWTEATPLVRVAKYLGAPGQVADAALVTASGGEWASTATGDGVCYITLRITYDHEVFGQGGLPEVKLRVRGARVYDPRKDSTVSGGSGAHRFNDPSTWEWSENAALIAADWQRDSEFGVGAAAGEVIGTELITEANLADELVALYNTGTAAFTNGSANVTGTGTAWSTHVFPGMTFVAPGAVEYTVASVTDDTHLVLTANYAGSTASGQAYTVSQRRYTFNGSFETDTAPKDSLEDVNQAMAGKCIWSQGRWRVRVGAHRTPTVTITADQLAGGVSGQCGVSIRDDFNAVRAVHRSMQGLWPEQQAPLVTNATYEADDGGERVVRTIQLASAMDSMRAQRLAKIELELGRMGLTAQLPCNLAPYDLAPGDTVAVLLDRYGWASKVFEVGERTFAPPGLHYALRETASGVWAWNYGDETAFDLAPDTSFTNPRTPPAALTGLAADSTSAQQLVLGNGSIVPRAKLTWTASSDIWVLKGGRIEVQFKLDSDATWSDAPAVPGDATVAYVAPVQYTRQTLFRIRPVNESGRAGAWTTIVHLVGTAAGAGGGGNLLSNSSFEVDSNGDGLADSWTAYASGTTGTVTRSLVSTGARHGSKVQRVACAGLGTTASDRAGFYQSISQSGSGRLTLRVGVKANAGSHLRLVADFVSGGSTVAAIGSTTLVATGDWQDIVFAGDVPAFDTVNVYCWQEQNTSLSGATADWDAAQLVFGAATAYSPRADEILAGAVDTTELADEAATSVLTTTSSSGLASIAYSAIGFDCEMLVTAEYTATLVRGASNAGELCLGIGKGSVPISGNLANAVLTIEDDPAQPSLRFKTVKRARFAITAGEGGSTIYFASSFAGTTPGGPSESAAAVEMQVEIVKR